MLQINATHINYFHVCHRKLWLFCNGINMEHTSDLVSDGKLLHAVSYPQRAEKRKEIEISASIDENIVLNGKIDFFDAVGKVIHETKRSDKIEIAHEWQVKYYIWLFELNNIAGVKGIIEYPKLRINSDISLTEGDKRYLEEVVNMINKIRINEVCPPLINSKICRNCSYHDLCYADEI
ncbi:CRISPR-associated protein Cas4 [Chitinophaga sp.]|uniref:CRISPR-associated protein Cas4 n=1 Tax=Chitinophaga sp. TaxID=1869181 RepID=UPI0031D8E36B